MGVDKTLRLNNKELLEYYRKFNSIEYKYGKYINEFVDEPLERAELMKKLAVHEQARNFSELTKKNMNSTVMNLEKIYGKRRIAENIVKIYHLVYTKVIGEYINIDGVERLFNDKYANYEWELHLGMNYESHEMNYYRDHFIHQVKDAFTMDRLLENGYLGTVRNILKEESNSKISAFVKKYVDIQCEKDNYFVKLMESMAAPDKGKFTKEMQKDYYTDNIIKMSCYISALFHDIGYPIVNNMKGNQDIMEYIFETYNLNDYIINFNKITALLGNSLLFRVEPIKKIKKRLAGNDEVNQEIDHGVVSAIVFLLHFYENGAIHRLEPYKICAVELAGLAIYNHTNKYSYINEKAADYEKNIFFQNPISHLLRISDDMQEWGRIYFELTDKSNLIICEKCKMPIVRIDSGENQDEGITKYWCNCAKDGINFKRVFPEDGFSYCRIYKLTICEEVKIEWNENLKEEHIHLDYDLNRLLHIAYISPMYASYRSKEIKKLKRLFLRQGTPYSTYVHTFMSANIIAIKSEIIGERLLKEKLDEKSKDFIGKLKDWDIESCLEEAGNLKESIIKKDEEIIRRIEEIDSDKTVDYLKDSLDRYMELYVYMYFFSLYNEFELEDKRKTGVKKLRKHLVKQDIFDKQSDKNAKYLIKDYIKYAKRRFFNVEKYLYYPKSYFQEFDCDERLYIVVSEFCKTASYKESGLMKNQFNAYSDLYLFQILYELSYRE